MFPETRSFSSIVSFYSYIRMCFFLVLGLSNIMVLRIKCFIFFIFF